MNIATSGLDEMSWTAQRMKIGMEINIVVLAGAENTIEVG
jgi:hypothetical protein